MIRSGGSTGYGFDIALVFGATVSHADGVVSPMSLAASRTCMHGRRGERVASVRLAECKSTN